MDSITYFHRCDEFKKQIEDISEGSLFDNNIMESLCKRCPHRSDTHQMNCVECCPIERRRNKVTYYLSKESASYMMTYLECIDCYHAIKLIPETRVYECEYCGSLFTFHDKGVERITRKVK
jgi:DNA-directed RNA polymerase subunit RPC12/RpoP